MSGIEKSFDGFINGYINGDINGIMNINIYVYIYIERDMHSNCPPHLQLKDFHIGNIYIDGINHLYS